MMSDPPFVHIFGSQVGEEELEEIRSSFDAQWLGVGPKTERFQEAFAKRLGLPGIVFLSSGSNSLQMAVKLLDLPQGSEVIVPSFTWIACAQAVLLAGCTPIFCDVDIDTQNVTAETVSRAVSKKTGAVMVVHYAGLPVAVDDISALGFSVIEDAAHAVNSTRGGRPCGGIGEIGIYSFDAVKNLTTGEGGGLTARDPARLKRAKELRYCGIDGSGFKSSANKNRWWEYEITDIFPKMLPNDVAASIGLAQLRKLDALQHRRKVIWESYQREFESVPWLTRPRDASPGDQHSYFTYCIRIDGGRRDDLAKYLYGEGIYTTLRFHPLHLNPIFRSAAKLPACERLSEEALNLPLHPRLSASDVERVVEALKRFKT